jgi:hypothetical protein
MLIFGALVIIGGFYPKGVLDVISATSHYWAARF